ncbi:unnamed protein product, partial [Brassica oleracea]
FRICFEPQGGFKPLLFSLSLFFFSTYCVCNLSIYFADTRDYRITVDMLICALDHPMQNLMVLAEDFKEEDAVDNIYLLHHRKQNILLAYKQQAGSILPTENPRWLYESFLQA